MEFDHDSRPIEIPPEKQHDAKLIEWVMRNVARKLRDDPEFINPFYERMAAKIIAYSFAMFVKWLGITVLIAAGGGVLILLGALGRFPSWFGV